MVAETGGSGAGEEIRAKQSTYLQLQKLGKKGLISEQAFIAATSLFISRRAMALCQRCSKAPKSSYIGI